MAAVAAVAAVAALAQAVVASVEVSISAGMTPSLLPLRLWIGDWVLAHPPPP